LRKSSSCALSAFALIPFAITFPPYFHMFCPIFWNIFNSGFC
jgi:hypothetical protein